MGKQGRECILIFLEDDGRHLRALFVLQQTVELHRDGSRFSEGFAAVRLDVTDTSRLLLLILGCCCCSYLLSFLFLEIGLFSSRSLLRPHVLL